MKAHWPVFALLLSLICILGCHGLHSRPASVPASAVWVDNTFVYCSIEMPSSNHCTVYRDASGEILADGLFILSGTHAAAEKSDLQYVAFGEHGIYLADARVLVKLVPGPRDPSIRIVDAQLKTLASKDGKKPVDCDNADSMLTTDAMAECAITAFEAKRAFYLRYYRQYSHSFGFGGFAGDAAGDVYTILYSSGDEFEIGDRDGRVFDGGRGLVNQCPSPTKLATMEDGTLYCVSPVGVRLPAHGTR